MGGARAGAGAAPGDRPFARQGQVRGRLRRIAGQRRHALRRLLPRLIVGADLAAAERRLCGGRHRGPNAVHQNRLGQDRRADRRRQALRVQERAGHVSRDGLHRPCPSEPAAASRKPLRPIRERRGARPSHPAPQAASAGRFVAVRFGTGAAGGGGGGGGRWVGGEVGGGGGWGGCPAAMGGGVIVAQPTTITASIGVFSIWPVASELLASLGVKVDRLSIGANAGMYSPFQAPSPAQSAAVSRDLDTIYAELARHVGTARTLDGAR